MAACTPLPPTAGDDTITCNDAHMGAINTSTGNDKITINPGATINASSAITTDVGSDLVVINGGSVLSNIALGNNTTSAADVDRLFAFGGTFTNVELQTGAGVNPYMVLMGGAMTGGSLEIRRGSQNATIVFDGFSLNNAEGIELQSGNVGQAAAVNPTIYFRSGTFTAGELELVNTGGANVNPAASNVTLVFDPINSKDSAYVSMLANAAANGADSSLSKANLDAFFADGTHLNPNALHKMVMNVEEVELGGGNDIVRFVGAVNNGSGTHNLELNGAPGDDPGEFEATEFNGGTGADRMFVLGGSNLLLGEVQNFERLNVSGASKLTLSEEEYEFADKVDIDGTSELHLSHLNAVLETEEFELDDGAGNGRLAGLSDYYDTFATGGILRIGALPGGGGDDDDDDDDDDAGVAPSPANVVINTEEFENSGTITMMNGVVGDTLTINGDYSAHSNVALDAELGDSGSPTDKLVLNGGVAGHTTLFVNNVGGKGAFTGQGAGDGIEIVSAPLGLAPGTFALATNNQTGREEVLAGAFAYRLATTDDAALLQSDVLDQVPAYTTAPSVAQRYASLGLDTLYKRLGEIRTGQNSGSTNDNGLIWVRGNYQDVDVEAKEGFDFSVRSQGVLFGANAVILREGASNLNAGVFGGVGSADSRVNATIFGAATSSSVNLDGWSAGAYLTYWEKGRPGTGLYVDGVVKVDIFDLDMKAGTIGAHGETEGEALTASAEVGYGFGIGGGLVVQPQAQIGYTDTAISAFSDSFDLKGSYGTSESLLGRVGVQVQANLPTGGGGLISPYAIFNVYSEFEGNNVSEVAGTSFTSDVGGTWYSAGGGVNAQIAGNVSLYGAGEYDFGDVEGWQGSGGVKVNW